MKTIITILILFLLTACRQENTIHIQLPETYGLKVTDQIQANGKQLGAITDVKLFDQGRSILVTAKLNEEVKIPINSEFEVIVMNILGSKMIEVTYSTKTEFYDSNDTVVGFYNDPIQSLIDSTYINTIDLLMDSIIELDTLDDLKALDSLFESQTSIIIPTH